MTSTTKNPYAGHRFPPELISYTVWLYFRFPLSLRMVEEMLAFRGIEVSHETIRQWALKFGQEFANIIRRRLPRPGDKWHLDEVVLKIACKKHYLWRARTASCSMFWSRAGATRRRPSGCCASC
jgi:putative transposase